MENRVKRAFPSATAQMRRRKVSFQSSRATITPEQALTEFDKVVELAHRVPTRRLSAFLKPSRHPTFSSLQRSSASPSPHIHRQDDLALRARCTGSGTSNGPRRLRGLSLCSVGRQSHNVVAELIAQVAEPKARRARTTEMNLRAPAVSGRGI
jgi:hypothetical protein